MFIESLFLSPKGLTSCALFGKKRQDFLNLFLCLGFGARQITQAPHENTLESTFDGNEPNVGLVLRIGWHLAVLFRRRKRTQSACRFPSTSCRKKNSWVISLPLHFKGRTAALRNSRRASKAKKLPVGAQASFIFGVKRGVGKPIVVVAEFDVPQNRSVFKKHRNGVSQHGPLQRRLERGRV